MAAAYQGGLATPSAAWTLIEKEVMHMWIYVEGRWKLIVADCFATLVIVTAALWNLTDIHNAFCLLIGVAAAVLLVVAFSTSVGFWIVSVIFSMFWALIPIAIVGAVTDFDPIWVWVIGGLTFVICMRIHASER